MSARAQTKAVQAFGNVKVGVCEGWVFPDLKKRGPVTRASVDASRVSGPWGCGDVRQKRALSKKATSEARGLS